MQITLKTNRLGFIKIILPLFIAFLIMFLLSVISGVTYPEEQTRDDNVTLIVLGCEAALVLVVILLLAFLHRKKYVCTANNISVYSHNKLINQINIDDIIKIKYRKLRLSYIFALYDGEKFDGSCWRAYMYMKSGSRITLDIFDIKDAKKLKRLYGELVQIV